MNNPTIKPQVAPFKHFCMSIGALPTSYKDSLDYYETLLWLIKYLEETVIPVVNNNGEAVSELQGLYIQLKNYVTSYLNDETLQPLINNKLDEMAESGQLEQIIEQFLQSTAIWSFNTVAEMKEATNLINGSTVKTLGYYSLNDGGGATYTIRTKTNGDIVDNCFIVSLNSNTIVAELIIESDTINILQGGAIGDGTTDNKTIIQNIINKISENSVVFIPKGNFYCSDSITLKDKISIIGEEVKEYNVQPSSKLLFNSSGFTGNYTVNFKNLNIIGNNHASGSKGIDSCKCTIENCNISKFGIGIYTPRTGVINNCHIYDNTIGISGAIDSRIINNFIYNQVDRGIDLYNGSNDNIITNNKIEWNGGNGIIAYQTAHNIINNNIFDRNSLYGITLNDCSTINLIGNTFRRNYVKEGTYDTYSHIRIENSNNCNICDNMTIKGNSLDDGTGIEIPSTSIYITASHDLNLIGNNFSGAVNKQYATYANSGNLFRLDLNNQVLDNLQSIKSYFNIPASGSATQDIKIDVPENNSLPTYKKILFRCRTGTNSTAFIKEIIISVFKVYNTNYVVSFSDNQIGDYITLSGTYDATTGIATITFTSTLTTNNFSARLIELEI